MNFLALLVMVEESDKTSAKQFSINIFLFVPRICLAISTFHFLAWLERAASLEVVDVVINILGSILFDLRCMFGDCCGMC